jgi:hypothetical protein
MGWWFYGAKPQQKKLHGVPLVTGHDPEIATSDEN